MILVTVGSSGFQFDRLIAAIDRLELEEDILVQSGPSKLQPRRARCVPFLRFAELEDAIRSARIVITHAGVGSVLLALRHDKQPIVVPRRPQFGEVVDDHQVHFAERLARDNVVTLVRDPIDLPQTIVTQATVARAFRSTADGSLESDLSDYLDAVLNGASGSHGRPSTNV